MPNQINKILGRIIFLVFMLMMFLLFLIFPIITAIETSESNSAHIYITEQTFIREQEKIRQQAEHQAFLTDAWWWIEQQKND
ncbi:MAG: hypothetical protein FWG65_11915 [Turicibacter sp.]|nr:hypothetical protein [Turicibacter sp.]